jgi:hypothetical protein
LFDVYNLNNIYGNNYENYDSDDDDDDDDSNEKSYESSSENLEDYYEEITTHLSLLHLMRYRMGDNPNIKGLKIDKYYSNGLLYGTCNKNQNKEIYINDIIDIKNENINNIVFILNNIFVYDYNSRIDIEKILKL